MGVTADQIVDIGVLVIDQAEHIFEMCGASNDFCVQSVGAVAVFGGTNRLTWSPVYGWRLDRAYCTARFIAKYDELFWEK